MAQVIFLSTCTKGKVNGSYVHHHIVVCHWRCWHQHKNCHNIISQSRNLRDVHVSYYIQVFVHKEFIQNTENPNATEIFCIKASMVMIIGIVAMFTPCACARGKTIGFVCHLSSFVCRHKYRQISSWAVCKHNETFEIGKKTYLCLLWITEQGSQALQILHATPINHAYLQLSVYFLPMHRKTGQVLVGKGHKWMHATDTGIQVSDRMQHKHTF